MRGLHVRRRHPTPRIGSSYVYAKLGIDVRIISLPVVVHRVKRPGYHPRWSMIVDLRWVPTLGFGE